MAAPHNVIPTDVKGRFIRPDSKFRSTIQQGGPHPPEAGRYLLYVNRGCPWASRALIVRALKGLEPVIDLAVTGYILTAQGWEFWPDARGCTADPVLGATHLKQLYLKANPEYAGRYTVPVLWDKKAGTIVNNESSEIIRMFNEEFDEFVEEKYKGVHLYPEELRAEIDELNDWVYNTVNNGVYKTGFATTQAAYEENVVPLFNSLDRLEKILEHKTFLIGPGPGQLTEADVRLFATLVRFDVAYHGNFKCNLGTIRHDYPRLDRWLRRLYWGQAAFRDGTDFAHIKTGYYSMANVNPSGVVPLGPRPDILGPLEESAA